MSHLATAQNLVQVIYKNAHVIHILSYKLTTCPHNFPCLPNQGMTSCIKVVRLVRYLLIGSNHQYTTYHAPYITVSFTVSMAYVKTIELHNTQDQQKYIYLTLHATANSQTRIFSVCVNFLDNCTASFSSFQVIFYSPLYMYLNFIKCLDFFQRSCERLVSHCYHFLAYLWTRKFTCVPYNVTSDVLYDTKNLPPQA